MVSPSAWNLVDTSSLVHQSRWRQFSRVTAPGSDGQGGCHLGRLQGHSHHPILELWRRVGADSPWGASPCSGHLILGPLCLHLFSNHARNLIPPPGPALVTRA